MKVFSFPNAKEVKSFRNLKSFHWIKSVQPKKAEIQELSKKLGITLEEFWSNLDQRERPRIEEFDNFTLIVFKARDESTSKTVSFPIFLTSKFVVTASKKPIAGVKKFEEIIKTSKISNVEDFLYKLLDAIQRDYYLVLDELEKKIDLLEHKATKSANENTLEDIFKTKKTLIYFHNALTANREVVTGIERGLVKDIKKVRKFRPLYDDIVQLIDMEATYREILTGTLDIYMSSVSNDMNKVMKKVTSYASLILVPTLISGVYGMNFEYIPGLNWEYGYFFAFSLMIVSVVLLYLYFEKKDWI